MVDQAFRFQRGYVGFDLAHRLAESRGHGVKPIPEGSVLASPPYTSLIQSLLSIRQIALPAHDGRRIEATELMPRVERFTSNPGTSFAMLIAPCSRPEPCMISVPRNGRPRLLDGNAGVL